MSLNSLLRTFKEKFNSYRAEFKWPKRKQWGQILNILSRRERYAFLVLLAILTIGFVFLGAKFYLNHSEIKPAFGGRYTEAFIGAPRYLNPILSPLKDADRDLCVLIFSGLMKYDGAGNLVPDLAEKYAVGDFGKVYDLTLRPDLKWHDNYPLTLEDVIFTLETIQNPEYKSPLRPSWQGVEFEKINENSIRFKLKNPYAPFLHNLTFGILPKHLWGNISPANFALNEFNLKPVGSGPYKFSKLQKDKDGSIKKLEFEAFNNYHLGEPYISELIFQFFNSEENALSAYKKGGIDGLSFVSAGNTAELKIKYPELNFYALNLPRYFAIFFNQSRNVFLSDKIVRQALVYATDKKQLINDVLDGYGLAINSSFLPGMTGYSDQMKIYDFAPEHAKNLLLANGFTDANQDGILEKDNQPLEITLTTANWPELQKTAELVKAQWEKIGFKVNLDIKDVKEIQNGVIRPRQYQALLFGEVLNPEPDPFSFWHSSQKKDPGMNLSLYENREVDKLLEEARQNLEQNQRQEKYQKLAALINEDLPTILLFSVDYLFAAHKKINNVKFTGINLPSARLEQINQWYIETKRTWKR